MNRRVTFSVRTIYVQADQDGAERILAHLAKPGYPDAAFKKLRNWRLWLDPNASPMDNRSRRQIEQGIDEVWRQLSDAIAIGNRFDRAMAFHEGEARRVDAKLQEYAQPATAKEVTQWKYWLPVAHVAAGFRQVMFQRKQGLAFLSRTPREWRSIIHELLIEDLSWIEPTVEAAEGRLFMSRAHTSMQAPGETRHFVFVPQTAIAPANS